jgi:alanine racemase
MRLNKIAIAVDASVKIVPDVEINWLLTDSRTLSFPTGSLFFAIRTARNDGHKYIADLYQQQMRYFVVSEILPEFELMSDAFFLQVEDTVEALQKLASIHRDSFHIPIIGITGSNGKTVVKEWLYQLLQADYSITRSPRSYNSQIGVPFSVWTLNEQSQLGIFEAGISKPGEMKKLEPIIKPTIGIFTNLGDAHQENFQSLKQKCEEKMKLFTHAELLIFSTDNKFLADAVAQSEFEGIAFAWGNDSEADMQVLDIRKENNTTTLNIKFKNKEYSVLIPFTDDASIENALHCIATIFCLNIELSGIQHRFLALEPVAMRLELKVGIHNCLILNDSYNSDLNSLAIALDFLNQQATDKDLSKTLILSDILQTGEKPNILYSKVADLVRSKNIQRIIGIGNEISKFAANFSFVNHTFFDDTAAFLKSGLFYDFNHEIVLLKGSRMFHFEDISSKIELIAHETTLEVNLTALVDNLNYFRSKIQSKTKIMSMVKAFAYGSGAVEVARTLQHHRCDYLAVAVADEGADLRREGIRIPIVVMNPEKGSFGQIFDNNLEPEIYSFRLLDAFIKSAERLALTDYPIHVKIDSGMHRLGFEMADLEKLIAILKNQSQVKVRSVFSHLAGADESKFDNFTHEQVRKFVTCADTISQAFSHHIMRHVLNSAGIERFPEYQFDMVRLGIGHYGISTLPGVSLRQVCSLRTIILQIKNINAGDTVGYARKGLVDIDKRIAILPIGYADGYDRKLSNGVGEVLINGHRAKLIGNVSMDLISVDISNIEANEGDEVEIFGENLTISEIADWLQTIPYEILTSVSRRVKRVYFQE